MQRSYASAVAVVVALGGCLAVAGSGSAQAADLPQVKSSAANPVPACATPGRLQAFLKSRNPNLEPRFDTIAVDYMKYGEALGMRWDYAFFQMLIETGQLSFHNGSRAGEVKPQQNNFAGLGAAGNGEAGESFPDISTGVRAHLEHVMLYAGEKVDQPVAERTRKVQQWGVLKSWQKNITHPITYAEVAMNWKSKAYAEHIAQIGDKFYDEVCQQADPHPEYVAAARGQTETATAAAVAAPAQPEKVSGAQLARRAVAEGGDVRSSLGAGLAPKVKVLNAPATESTDDAAPAPQKTAAAGAGAKALVAPPEPPALEPEQTKPATVPGAGNATAGPQKCRVWTASYGGQRAVIVKAMIDKVANFTVLDVNEGQETREAEAFIAAYAKGGVVAEVFPNQDKALAKAFELCPEG